MILVDLDGVAVRQPERALFEDLSLTLSTGDRVGVVGRNGGGKSTLLRVLAGAADPDEGEVRRGRGVRVAHLDQRPDLPAGRVGDVLGSHWEAAAILDRLGMSGLVEARVGDLSGGEAKRLALARVLVAEAELLVLDEPTNHLDIAAITWLEERLAAFRGGLVMVTHDRHVLDRVTSRMLELDRGRAHHHQGGYQSYLAARLERAVQEESAEAIRRNLARAELEWLRRGARARTRKPKARVASAREIVQRRAPPPDRPDALEVTAPARGRSTPRLGDKVLVGEGVGHRHGDGPWLFRGLGLDLAPDGRLGVVGANGTGKSTLLDILAGRMEPAEGALELGVTARLGYYDQTGSELDPTAQVRDVVAGSAAQPGWEQARLMERFWFDGNAQWARVGTLSGGEQRRLQLLVVLAGMPNVLLMDEPTNDLDLDTLRALEDFLDDWPGSLVVVSHDRAHLARTVERVLVLDGEEGWHWSDDPTANHVEAQLRTRPRAVGSRPPKPEAAPVRAAKARSPGTIRRLMAQAEREVAQAEAERERLHAAMAGCTDHGALPGLAEELAQVGERLEAAERWWLSLVDELGA